MSPEKQRIAIAEACGWSKTDAKRGYTLSQFTEQVPDYLNDLNAMHEAEKVLTHDQASQYCDLLWVSASRAYDYPASYLISSSTAAQRAEAFLKTIGKWEETKETLP